MANSSQPRDTLDRQRELAFGRHMTDQEALMWNIEKDPWLNPSGAILTLFDRPVDMGLLLAKLRTGLTRIPRLRERPVPGLGRLSPPVWATDTEFDLDYHARVLRLPEPGSMRQLLDLAAVLYQEPYDRTRPLWVFYAIEGLEGGRGALLTKQHHSVADGIGALRMAEVYTDLQRDVPKPAEVDLDRVFFEAAVAERDQVLDAGADLNDSIVNTARRTVTHNVRRQVGIASRLALGAAGLVTNPAKAASALAGLADQGRGAVDTAFGARKVNAGAPLWSTRSRRRHLEALRLRLDDVKAAARKLDGSVNDFFVAGAAMGAIAYHDERQVPVEALNLTFVVSTRTDRAMGGNSFTPVPVQVPGGPLAAEERFCQLRSLMAERRESVRGQGAMGALAGIINLLPTSVTTRLARQQAAKIDFATSNLRGAPIQTYIAGAEVLAMITLGPVAGTAANLTALSQNGWLDMGLLVDPAAVADPDGLRQKVQEAYRDLLGAAGVEPSEPGWWPAP